MSDEIHYDREVQDREQRERDARTPHGQAHSPAPSGSETMGPKYRKQLALEMEILKDRLKWLERYTRMDSEDVVPHVSIESLLQSANHVAYLAGMVNGAKMARWEKSPNAELSHAAKKEKHE